MIYKIGAKVVKTKVYIIQSKRKGGFFFLVFGYDLEYQNMLTKYCFGSVLSVHSSSYGHCIRYTD